MRQDAYRVSMGGIKDYHRKTKKGYNAQSRVAKRIWTIFYTEEKTEKSK